jgi:hypothetical protein
MCARGGGNGGSGWSRRCGVAEMFVKGRVVLVDSWNLERVNRYSYFITKDGYAATRILRSGPVPAGQTIADRYYIVFMHQIVMEGKVPEGMEIDHNNRVKLDNREANLVPKTHAMNMLNMPEVRQGKTKGVYPRGKKFAVNLRVPGEGVKYFGTRDTIEEANELSIHKQAEIKAAFSDYYFANVAC